MCFLTTLPPTYDHKQGSNKVRRLPKALYVGTYLEGLTHALQKTKERAEENGSSPHSRLGSIPQRKSELADILGRLRSDNKLEEKAFSERRKISNRKKQRTTSGSEDLPSIGTGPFASRFTE